MNQEIKSLVDRVIDWNAARFERDYYHKLSVNLLTEEISEHFKAKQQDNLVEILDAYGDVLFVTIGIMWKDGMSSENITKVVSSIIDNIFDRDFDYQLVLTLDEHYKFNRPTVLLGITWLIQNTPEPTYPIISILDAICTSNETKDVVKLEGNEKGGKGENFIPPTEDLKEIISTCREIEEELSVEVEGPNKEQVIEDFRNK